jgi:hypothetical protein
VAGIRGDLRPEVEAVREKGEEEEAETKRKRRRKIKRANYG